MKNNLTPRYLIILVILGWSFYTLWPTIKYQNLTDDEKEILREEGRLEKFQWTQSPTYLDLFKKWDQDGILKNTLIQVSFRGLKPL